MSMLQFSDVHVHYGAIAAVNGISFTVNKGELVTIIGANGAGKTSIMMAITGIVPITSGTITFLEKNIHKKSTREIITTGIALVPERRRIFPRLTVQENLELGAILNKNTKQVQEDMDYVMSLFPILRERSTQLGGTLSGGEQQMLAIARAYMQHPTLLLLDEPSLGLAPIIIQKIFATLEQLRTERNLTILLVEQNVSLALHHSDRGYVLETGEVILEGDSQYLLNHSSIKEAYLGGHIH